MQNQHHKTAHVQPRNNLAEYEMAFSRFHEVMYQAFTSETLKEEKDAHLTLEHCQRELGRHLFFLDDLKHTVSYVNETSDFYIEPGQVAALTTMVVGLSRSIGDMLDSIELSYQHYSETKKEHERDNRQAEDHKVIKMYQQLDTEGKTAMEELMGSYGSGDEEAVRIAKEKCEKLNESKRKSAQAETLPT